jgi:signal transduction histidine kinase
MRESVLGNDDLSTALDAFARQRAVGTGIDVSVVTSGGARRLKPALEDAAFRIGREAVANAVRHADARRIEIRLDFDETRLHLEVRDDGCGFTPEKADEARRLGHFGLSGMLDRAAGAGGDCQLLARPGEGTTLILDLPT